MGEAVVGEQSSYGSFQKASAIARGCQCDWRGETLALKVLWFRRPKADCPLHGITPPTCGHPTVTLGICVRCGQVVVDTATRGDDAPVLRQAQDERGLGAADLIADRAEAHGDFLTTARIEQALRGDMADAPNWLIMRDVERSAVGMMLTKLARIGSGDPHYIDHWRDIAGYAQLVVDDLLLREPDDAELGA